jgi:mono/diheme cytochrome c family protein
MMVPKWFDETAKYLTRLCSGTARVRGFSIRLAYAVLIGASVVSLSAASLHGTQDTVASKSHIVPPGNAETGRKLYVRMGCYDCHGYEGQGSLRNGPRIGPNPIPFPDFVKEHRTPSGQMPPYTEKIISDQGLADIYAFLSSLPPPPDPKTIPILK